MATPRPSEARLLRQVVRNIEALLPSDWTMTTLAEPVEPSVQLWQRIESSLKAQGRSTPAAAQAAVPAPRRPTRPAVSPGWWSSVTLWRGLAGTGFAAVALQGGRTAPEAKLLSKPFHLKDLVAEVDRIFQSEDQHGRL